MDLINEALLELISDENFIWSALPFKLSSEILNHNLLSNCELSFIPSFFYSGFLFTVFVEDLSTAVRAH